MARRLSVAAVLGGTVLAAGIASAQTSGPPFERNIDVQQWRPAPGPNNFLTVQGARVDGNMAFSVSGWFNWSNQPFLIYNANCPNPNNDDGCTPGTLRSQPVQNMLTFNLQGTLTLFRRLQIGLDVPLTYESGQLVNPNDASQARNPNGTLADQSAFGVGDPRLELKLRIVGDGLSGPAFGVSLFGQAPLGQLTATNSFVGDASVVFGGRLIGEFRRGSFAIAGNAGVIIRPQPERILTSYVSNRLTWGLAASYDFTPRIGAILEFFGSTDLTNPTVLQNNVIEGDLAARFRVGDLAILAGGGPGILRGLGSPVVRLFAGVSYAPFRVDGDRDGVMDDVDRCPTEPEDRDGFEDGDGCPDPDNDGDGINDERDRCPNAAEDRDGFQDEDGCPDPDNDGDGVPDGFDSCPREPEDRDGDHDEDGCPDNDRDRDGVPDDRDRCPTDPEDTDGFQDEDGCPDPDNDNDGVPDSSDQCDGQPETINSFQDDDGCPDTVPDRDHDGIPDDRDRCPEQPETYNGITDDDGCPERGPSLVAIEGNTIRILQQVNFATNSDRIVGARSFAVLDAVASVLRAHPEFAHVEVQGHTDNRGDADANRSLSNRRALSVRLYLTQHGIEEARLTGRGFGPDQPIESNSTSRGRARNRRVEFHLVGSGGQEVHSGGAVSEPAPSSGSAPAPAAGSAPAAHP